MLLREGSISTNPSYSRLWRHQIAETGRRTAALFATQAITATGGVSTRTTSYFWNGVFCITSGETVIPACRIPTRTTAHLHDGEFCAGAWSAIISASGISAWATPLFRQSNRIQFSGRRVQGHQAKGRKDERHYSCNQHRGTLSNCDEENGNQLRRSFLEPSFLRWAKSRRPRVISSFPAGSLPIKNALASGVGFRSTIRLP